MPVNSSTEEIEPGLLEDNFSPRGVDQNMETEQQHEPKCLKLKLKPNVSKLNVSSFILGYFAAMLISNLMSAFATYLLDDRHGITGGKAGKVMGNIGTVCSILAILS